mmetsp:Transcript_865/g.2463  ORF Transcript_865/g.2463 Transcript_865/m.2463 type:complete len:208 (+) Transcript_865:174-797(+)
MRLLQHLEQLLQGRHPASLKLGEHKPTVVGDLKGARGNDLGIDHVEHEVGTNQECRVGFDLRPRLRRLHAQPAEDGVAEEEHDDACGLHQGDHLSQRLRVCGDWVVRPDHGAHQLRVASLQRLLELLEAGPVRSGGAVLHLQHVHCRRLERLRPRAHAAQGILRLIDSHARLRGRGLRVKLELLLLLHHTCRRRGLPIRRRRLMTPT